LNNNLGQNLKQKAEQLGVSFYGVADLAVAQQAIEAQGGSRIARFPFAISVGIALQHPLVDALPHQDDLSVIMSYRSQAYDVVNGRLDAITSTLASILQAEGYQALPVPASQTVNRNNLTAIFSHKLAAHLAGLGWIGKSCLLVTPQVGPRVRWGTVLTTAPLAALSDPMEEQCGDCDECVRICPVQAFSGQPYRLGEPRDVRFAAHKCSQYFTQREKDIGYSVCGLCLYVCPHGRKHSRNLL
jgi:epoxyqueuosine reductase